MAIFSIARRKLFGLLGGLSAVPRALSAGVGPSTGAKFFPRTKSEIAAGVEPSNLQFEPGNVLRYGAAGDGIVDDTAAIVDALRIREPDAMLLVILPAGYEFKITSYCRIYSDTTIHLHGTLLLTGRASGLFADGASNIGIYGFKSGKITDSVVAATFVWNPVSTTDSPAIHLRSVSNATIDGINILYVSSGILVSTCTTNSATPGGAFVLSQRNPVDVSVRDNHISFTEYGALCAFQPINLVFENNYVYRCGDGGIWMMGARDSSVINNKRISPAATPEDVARYGSNRAAYPSTWNDEQGMEFENCHGLLIANNFVNNFAGIGIDIKNGSTRVLCVGNHVAGCQAASICTREGDAVKNACIKITIMGNCITSHGTLHYPTMFSAQGAIRTGETYICEILNNIIYGYQKTVGIGCYGPGEYQAQQFPKDAQQSSLVVAGNCVDFKNSSFENETEVPYTADTPTAILVNGSYNSVRVTDNKITGDIYFGSDARFGSTPAIRLSYGSSRGNYYPSNAKLDGNSVSAWGGSGIVADGLATVKVSGLSICNNSLGALGEGPFIAVSNAHFCNIVGNTLSQLTAGPGAPGILVSGTAENALEGANVSNNQIAGAWNTGSNALLFGIAFDYCNHAANTNNIIAFARNGDVVQRHPFGT